VLAPSTDRQKPCHHNISWFLRFNLVTAVNPAIRFRRTSWLILLALPAVAFQAPQEPQQFPPIRVEVQLVSFNATVTDREGRAVTGLKKEDFTVLENGVPQDIAVFHDDERVPVSIGIIFDTSGSMVDKIEGVQDAAIHFANTTNPEDDIFLIRFSSNVSLVQDFTNDRGQLKRAIGGLHAQGSTLLYDAILEGLEHLQAGQHKKKALLVITDGNDTSSSVGLQETIATVQQSEAIVYALGIGHGERGSFGHLLFGGHEDRVNIEALTAIASASGGRAVLVEGPHHRGKVDQIDQAALQVSAELRNQYTIAYYPKNRAKDGTFRRLEIRTVNPNYTVRARNGYVAPRENAPAGR